MRIRHPDRTRTANGFTLVELLVVMGILLALAALSIPIIGQVSTIARTSATRGTITKIDGLLKERLRAFDIAFEENRTNLYRQEINQESRALRNQGLSENVANRLAPIIVRKRKMQELFPLPHELGSANPASDVASAAALYEFLTNREVVGIPPVGEDAFTTREVKTEGNRTYFVDAWGNPLRFYRWPTRLIRPGGPGAGINTNLVHLLSPGLTESLLNQDPDDPLGELSHRWNDPNDLENTFHTPDTYHMLLIVSAGLDGELGLYEPGDQANYGHLAMPRPEVLSDPLNSELNDNITNRQAGGGN